MSPTPAPPHPLASAVGHRVADRVEPHVLEASVDTIRLFARAYGDDNPLYSDAGYARATARGRLVAPPLFPLATGTPAPDDASPTVDLEAFGAGLGQRIAGDEWWFLRPVVDGTRLERTRHIRHVETAGAAPDACTVTVRTRWQAGGRVYAVNDRVREYRPAEPGPRAGDGRRTATYRPEELDAFDRALASADRLGAGVRRLEDITPGDTLGELLKGPMTVTDMVAYRGGVGPGPLGGEPMRMAYLNRLARPRYYTPDDSGVADIVERRHYDQTYARRLGLPGADDYSHTRLTWMTQLLGDWMGDGGWLWRLSGSTTLAANYVGDTHWLTGEVVAVHPGDGFGAVDVAVRGRNQLGQTTCTATATVLLAAGGATHVADADIEGYGGAEGRPPFS